MIWADRGGSIGYKVIGSLPLRRGGCPDVPKPGWSGEFEWEGTVPYEELPDLTDPESGFLVTANNRVVGDSYPHHVSSEWFDGFRALRIEQMLARATSTTSTAFSACRPTPSRSPASKPHDASACCPPRVPAGDAGDREAAELGRKAGAGLDLRLLIYQAFLLRLAREMARAAIGDRDLAERWLDRADNGFIAHVTSPWRWHSHLMDLWAEADDGLVGRPWDDLVLDSLRGALDDLETRFGTDPEGWRWGEVHEMEFSHPLGAANPVLRRLLNRRLRSGGAQETVCQVAYDPNDPYRAVWAPSWRMVADPADPAASRWQAFTGQSGHPGSTHYDDLQRRWQDGQMQPMAGEGPWRTLTLEPD